MLLAVSGEPGSWASLLRLRSGMWPCRGLDTSPRGLRMVSIRTVIRAAEAHPRTAAAIGGGILAVVAAPVALAAAGFGSAGVAAGSAAAAWQASIGNVAAGSVFAACQSAGAAGMTASASAGVGAWEQ